MQASFRVISQTLPLRYDRDEAMSKLIEELCVESKNSNIKKIKPVTIPGQVVSCDQLVSYTPGLITTNRGLPTTKRYSGATILVDHASNFTYVHLMEGTPDAEKTVEAAQAFA